jgi:hypothetical protein
MSVTDLDQAPIFEGELMKKRRTGFAGFRAWQPRYAILFPDQLILLEKTDKDKATNGRAKEVILKVSRYSICFFVFTVCCTNVLYPYFVSCLSFLPLALSKTFIAHSCIHLLPSSHHFFQL